MNDQSYCIRDQPYSSITLYKILSEMNLLENKAIYIIY